MKAQSKKKKKNPLAISDVKVSYSWTTLCLTVININFYEWLKIYKRNIHDIPYHTFNSDQNYLLNTFMDIGLIPYSTLILIINIKHFLFK